MTSPKSAEIFQIAVHEMGHFEAALYYGIAASPKVFREAERFKTTDGKTIVGECKLEFLAKATLFHKSVIGWSGYLAEHICGVQHPSICNPFPLHKSFLKSFCYAAIADAEKIFSYSDQVLIFGYKSHLRSFNSAYGILKKEKSKLLRVAKSYQLNFKSVPALPGIPSPEKFPATHADFVRLVCSKHQSVSSNSSPVAR